LLKATDTVLSASVRNQTSALLNVTSPTTQGRESPVPASAGSAAFEVSEFQSNSGWLAAAVAASRKSSRRVRKEFPRRKEGSPTSDTTR
jgi:hypothetical protein